MTESIAYVDIKDGAPWWEEKQRQAIIEYFREQPNGRYYIAFQKDYPDRSLGQNNWMWGEVYRSILNKVNEGLVVKLTLQDIHIAMMELFAPRRLLMLGRFQYDVIVRTSEMDTAQMTQYLECLRRFAADELGIDIPDPDPKLRRK